jgi:uncharacterized membrane protein YbhN (UPF0104 family)
MNEKSKVYLKRFIKFILFLAVVYFAGRQLASNWSGAIAYSWKLNFTYLSISFILHMITLILFSRGWCTVLEALGHRIGWIQGFKISYLANLGRYIPGKFWQIFGMIYLLRQVNVGKKTAFASWALSWMYGLPPAFLLSGIAAFFYRDLLSGLLGGFFDNYIYIIGFLILVIVLSIVFLFVPDYSIKFLNFVLKLLRREKVDFQFKKVMALRVFALYFISWIIYGAAFYFLIKGLDPTAEVPFMVGLGAFVLAYVVGLLALFSPGGLGVRELILNLLLSPFFGPVVAGIVIAARIWSLVAEIASAGIALLIHLKRKGEIA